MKPEIIICLSVALFLFSCKTAEESTDQTKAATQEQKPRQEPAETHDEIPQSNLEEFILGDWGWEKTICCGRTPHTETPETLNSAKTMRFQKGGMVVFLSGNEILSTQTYHISYGLSDGDKRPVIIIGASRPGLLFIKDDTLIIDYGYVDLQQEYYVRRK